MTGPDPAEFTWWLASRAAGIVALLCITVSVGIGLAMAGRISRRPALARAMLSVHQQTALIGLVAIAVHGITLLGDRFLSPSIGDLVLPFTSEHEPLWTGLGVTGGWLAAILGLSYWVRHLIGAALWRKLHRATVLVYVLSVAHTLGAGTDASEPWMRMMLVITGAPILFLFLMRVLTPRAATAFRRFRVTDTRPESGTVTSLFLAPADGRPSPRHEPGQFLTLAVKLAGGERKLRSYSISDAPASSGYRISVKREADGEVSDYLHTAVQTGDVLELSPPSGRFVLGDGDERPLVLISAGIGVTPVLSMLATLAARRSEREVWWLHGARNGAEHAFRSEVRGHLACLPRSRCHVSYSQPHPSDRLGQDYDVAGRLSADCVMALGVPTDGEVRLCGPTGFVSEMTEGLVAQGVAREQIRSESFGGPSSPAPTRPPLPFSHGEGPAVAFARSGVTTAWTPDFTNLLELAEAHAVPASSGCRIGACQGCRATVISGSIRHDPEPLEPAPAGSALLCCAVPDGDVVLDA